MARTSVSVETATRYVGNCQICEGDQKLHEGRMVHHGYKRPGDGSIHGDCPGVYAAPYEVSCDLIKAHKTGLEARLVHLKARLAAIKAGQVTHFTEIHRSFRGGLEVDEYALGVTDPYRFTRGLERLSGEVEYSIRQTASTIERFTQRIAAWKPMPIRTIEEELRKEAAAKAERKAVRDAARAERAAKKAATKAKQEALAARRKAIVEGLVAELRTLAAQPASHDRDAAARKIWDTVTGRTGSKKYPWLWIHELLQAGAEAPTLALGLTRRDPDSGRVRY